MWPSGASTYSWDQSCPREGTPAPEACAEAWRESDRREIRLCVRFSRVYLIQMAAKTGQHVLVHDLERPLGPRCCNPEATSQSQHAAVPCTSHLKLGQFSASTTAMIQRDHDAVAKLERLHRVSLKKTPGKSRSEPRLSTMHLQIDAHELIFTRRTEERRVGLLCQGPQHSSPIEPLVRRDGGDRSVRRCDHSNANQGPKGDNSGVVRFLMSSCQRCVCIICSSDFRSIFSSLQVRSFEFMHAQGEWRADTTKGVQHRGGGEFKGSARQDETTGVLTSLLHFHC